MNPVSMPEKKPMPGKVMPFEKHSGKGGEMDHKAAISKMHPAHVHKLVQDAHAGKFGPQAQQVAQQAMQQPAAPQDGDPNDPTAAEMPSGKSSMFSSGGAPAPAAPAAAPNRSSMFGSGR